MDVAWNGSFDYSRIIGSRQEPRTVERVCIAYCIGINLTDCNEPEEQKTYYCIELHNMNVEAFSKLNKVERYRILLKISKGDGKGAFLASRLHSGFQVGLFRVSDFYVEIWKRIGLDTIDYIEVVDEAKVREAYLENLDLPPLDLD